MVATTWIFGLPGWVPVAIAIVAFAAAAGELFSWVIRSILRRAGAKRTTLRMLREILRATWILLAAFGVASVASLTSVLTVLTVSGILGLAVTLALQTTMSNMVSALMLQRNQALRLGDVISFGGVRGKVIRVSLVNTWIYTDDGNLAFVGNTSLLGGPFVNVTAKGRFPEFLPGAIPSAAPPPTAKPSVPSADKTEPAAVRSADPMVPPPTRTS